jgi:hypothetical protein
VFGDADSLVVIGGIELGAVASPGSILQHAIDLPDTRRWQTKSNNLSNSHHDIPAHNLDPGGRELLIKPLPCELSIQLAKGAFNEIDELAPVVGVGLGRRITGR